MQSEKCKVKNGSAQRRRSRRLGDGLRKIFHGAAVGENETVRPPRNSHVRTASEIARGASDRRAAVAKRDFAGRAGS